MSKAEILAELPRLSPEDRAEVQAKLDELARSASRESSRAARIATPRLADPRQAADFRKQVTELRSDAAV
ncbi:MAG: hypothetical protein WBD40_10870 [Tepidisphaeraceae bacterium]